MHRLTFSWAAIVLALLTACGGKSKEPDTAAGKVDTGDNKPDDDAKGDGAPAGDKNTSASGGAADMPAGEKKKNECEGFEIGNIEDVLLKSSCEEAGTKPDSIKSEDTKGKLDVTVTATPTKTTPGGKVDLLVAFTNKTKSSMTLHFRIDPMPRFEVEAYDKKGKRADMPAGNAPPPPKGATQPPPSEPKAAKITLAPNGSARMRVPWEAVKTKWAPEKYKGAPPERGYPRAPAGPLGKGKYTVKVLTPLVGVLEGLDKEISAPKVEIEVDK